MDRPVELVPSGNKVSQVAACASLINSNAIGSPIGDIQMLFGAKTTALTSMRPFDTSFADGTNVPDGRSTSGSRLSGRGIGMPGRPVSLAGP